jgi:hypothetical protein
MSQIVKIIAERHSAEYTSRKRTFQRIGDDPGNGFSFPCKEDGSIDKDDQFFPFWRANYEHCLEHPEIYQDLGAVEETHTYMVPAVGQCSCGCEVILQRDTACDGCGQWYNSSGQALKDPEYWEEEYCPYDI